MSDSSIKKKILLLHTGGTLGMDLEGSPDDSEVFLRVARTFAPQIFDIADIHIEIMFNKDSSNMLPQDWISIAKRLFERMAHFDGFVVIHGTDTMAFTASALSFMLKHCPKPVIITGSQRPLKDLRSDAPRNLTNAVEIAAQGKVQEVAIFFDSALIRGNRAKKISIPSFKAFESPNLPVLASVGVKTEYFPQPIPSGVFELDPRIETRILSIPLFPGFDPEIFSTAFRRGIKGLVLQAFGPGDIPLGETSIVTLIRGLLEQGIPTVICSQAIFGRVDLNLYETGRAARDAGAISAHDMTWECAVVKMMVLLGRGLSLSAFRSKFQKNLSGELSEIGTPL